MATPRKPKPKPYKGAAIAACVAALLGVGVWFLSQNIAGVTRPTAPPTPTVNLLPPPPPPPPPTKEPPPTPEKTVEEPKAADQAKPDNQPKQLTIAGPPQAGGDSFGVGAGKGGGSAMIGGSGEDGPGGGGFEEASYARFLSSQIQDAVQSNPRIDRSFSTADVAIWISADGRVTQVKIRRSSGNDKIDAELVATLERMRPLSDLPPAAFKFPREVKVRGARG